jgi:hypothetical protein
MALADGQVVELTVRVDDPDRHGVRRVRFPGHATRTPSP